VDGVNYTQVTDLNVVLVLHTEGRFIFLQGWQKALVNGKVTALVSVLMTSSWKTD